MVLIALSRLTLWRPSPLFASLAALDTRDLGCISKFHGMRVTHNGQRVYTLDQEETIGDRLSENGIADAANTAEELAGKVSNDVQETADKVENKADNVDVDVDVDTDGNKAN